MRPLAFDLRDSKKIAADPHSSTFQMKGGHTLRIAHAPLSAIHRKMIEKMPVVQKLAEGDPSVQADPEFTPPSDSTSETPAPDSPANAPLASNTGPSVMDLNERNLRKNSDEILAKTGGAGGASGDWGSDSSLPAPSTSLPDQGKPLGGAPSSNSGSIPPSGSGLPNISVGSVYAAGQAANQSQYQANTASSAARLAVDQKMAQDQAETDAFYDAQLEGKKSEIGTATQEVKDGAINPNHYLENQSIPGKIASAIGIILGGASSGVTGRNPGMDFLNAQIGRDIASQEKNQENRKTVLGAYQQQYQNTAVAKHMALSHLQNVYSQQLLQAADQTGNLQAKAQLQKSGYDLQAQSLSSVQMANGLDMLNQRAQQKESNPGAFSGSPIDLPAFNYLQKRGLMPQQDVELATKEAQTYSNHVQQVGTVMAAFDQAAKDNTIGNRALHGGFEPASVSVLKTSLLPYLKDAEGKINQSELERTDGLIPGGGDFHQKSSEKRIGLAQFLTEKNDPNSFPTLSRYGLINRSYQPNIPSMTGNPGNSSSTQHRVGDILYHNGQKIQVIDAKGNYRAVR